MSETNLRATEGPPARRANKLYLILPFGIAAVLVVVYWFIWSHAAGIMKTEIAKWEDQQRAAGFTVEHGEVSVEGFPFLLRARIETPFFATPQTSWSWQSETLYADTSPFNPTRIILSPLGSQKLIQSDDDGRVEWDMEADAFRISLSEAKTGLDLRNVTARPSEESDTELAGIFVESLIANSVIADDPETGRKNDLGKLAVSGRNIVLDHRASGQRMALLEADLAISATGVNALATRQPGESRAAAWQRGDGEMTIDGIRLIVSDGQQAIPTQLRASGTLHVDTERYPAGELELAMKDHMALLKVLESRDVLTPRESEQADTALRFLAAAMGEEIEAPLQLRGGKLRLGPVKIMDLDRLD